MGPFYKEFPLLILNPEHHKVRETEAARFLRREFNEPDWFLFWNETIGGWVLGQWIDKSRLAVEDLLDIPGDLEAGPALTTDIVNVIRACHHKPDYQRLKQKLIEKHRAELRADEDRRRAFRDMREWAAKKTNTQKIMFQG